MALRILRTDHDGLTGHISMLVRIEEESSPGNTSHGPEETIAIWPRALMSTYHGDGLVTKDSVKAALAKWVAERHSEILERKRHAELTAGAASDFHGQLIHLPVEGGI